MKRKNKISNPVWSRVFHYPQGYSIMNSDGLYLRSFIRHPISKWVWNDKLNEPEYKVENTITLTDSSDLCGVIPDCNVELMLRYMNIYHRDYSKLEIDNHEHEREYHDY
jgi:hypothetical protein